MLIGKTDTTLDIETATVYNQKTFVSLNNNSNYVLELRMHIPELFLKLKAIFFKEDLASFAGENPEFNLQIINKGQSYDPGEQGVYRTRLYLNNDTPVVELIANHGKVDAPILKADADEITAFIRNFIK